MTVDERTGAATAAPSDLQQLRAEIEADRAQLGDTVEELVHKADLRAQVQQTVEQRMRQLQESREQAKAKLGDAARQTPRPAPIVAAASALAIAAAALVLIRRR